ncbi:MAG: glycosyltransferase [Vulcanimicrobiota bacterium]
MEKQLGIVIPVYNEGENIKTTLQELEEKIKTPYSAYIVYDFEEDNTLPPAREFMKNRDSIKLEKNRYWRGALNALKTGVEAVEEDIVLVSMADLSDDVAIVDEMVEKARAGCQVVCASRYMKGGKQFGGPWLKKQMSRIAGITLHYIVGINTHDATNNFRMYSRKLLDEIEIESTGGFEFALEVLVKAHIMGRKICEIPTVWRDRAAGESRFKLWQWLPKYFKWYMVAISSAFNNLFKRQNG